MGTIVGYKGRYSRQERMAGLAEVRHVEEAANVQHLYLGVGTLAKESTVGICPLQQARTSVACSSAATALVTVADRRRSGNIQWKSVCCMYVIAMLLPFSTCFAMSRSFLRMLDFCL